MTQALSTFSSFGLSKPLLKALTGLGFVTPSPIQQQTIPALLEGSDLIGLAQTGTGKTAAFALPVLQRLDMHQVLPQALIIAPTRELAIQVAEHFETLSAHQAGVRISVLCGGQDYRPQLKSLRAGAHVVVGTPGRVLDHLERGSLKLHELRTFVLDEADEMLRMGFIEDVETILSKLPDEKQIALFSATMPGRIRQIATRYLNAPITVEIRMETATVKSIEQRFLIVPQAQKPEALLRVLAVEAHHGVIVFVRTKSSADELADYLQQNKLHAMAIHGDLTQGLRERIITQFKQGAIQILVATDVAARGLDVERVTHVINYDMPQDSETYVHRIGRTGRAGRSGVTILFITPKEGRMLSTLERHIRQRIEKMPMPTDAMIQKVRQQRFLEALKQRLNHEHLPAYRQMLEGFINEQTASAVDTAAGLALMLNQDKPWQVDFPKSDLNRDKFRAVDKKNSDRFVKRSEKSRKASSDIGLQEIFRLDVGKSHGVKPGNIIGAIANEAGLHSRFITGLKIHDHYSTVRLPQNMPKDMKHHLMKARVCGRPLNLKSLGAA